MTVQARRIAERRGRARELRERGLATREIGERLKVSKSTIASDLAFVSEPGVPVPNAAGPGNDRAAKHGVYSERRIAPVRERHARDLAERYPGLDPGRRATEAQRRAMIELASAWIDEKGTVVRNDEGSTYDIAVKVAAWLASSERWMERVEDELRQPAAARGFEALLAEGREAWRQREAIDSSSEEAT